MIDLEISNYAKPFAYMNGHRQQVIRPLDLARAIVTVGQGSWTDVYNLGIFRIGELICKALAFSKLDGRNLVLQDRFFNLNQSEKATVSYYFGQGLTKLYAEEYFKIKWLFHVDDYMSSIQFHTRGIATTKLTVGKSTKLARRPDLIGLKQTNVSHIFEAKGNSSGYDLGVMQHAINQVSQVRTYNGIAPATRAACYFDLSRVPIKGIIIDPDEDENGIDIKLDEDSIISEYYSFFKENSVYFNNSFEFNGFEFLTTPVGVPNIYFGFDKRLLSIQSSEILSNGLYEDVTIFMERSGMRREEVSLGLDGLILINVK